MDKMKTCAECHERVLRDYGYSDHTVEGTTIYCMRDLNAGYPAEEPHTYEQYKAPHNHAESCAGFVRGQGHGHFSVEEDLPEDVAKVVKE